MYLTNKEVLTLCRFLEDQLTTGDLLPNHKKLCEILRRMYIELNNREKCSKILTIQKRKSRMN